MQIMVKVMLWFIETFSMAYSATSIENAVG